MAPRCSSRSNGMVGLGGNGSDAHVLVSRSPLMSLTAGKEDEGFSEPIFEIGDLWMVHYSDVSSIDLRCCVCCFFVLQHKILGCLNWVISNVANLQWMISHFMKDCLRCGDG